jgi:hypothetical protein
MGKSSAFIENPTRSAPATLVLFRANGEYVEHHFWAIEQTDKEVTMSAGGPHVVVVGSWRQAGSRILATAGESPERFASWVAPILFASSRLPLCSSKVRERQSGRGGGRRVSAQLEASPANRFRGVHGGSQNVLVTVWTRTGALLYRERYTFRVAGSRR